MIRITAVLLITAGAFAAPPGVPDANGQVWIQPSIVDASRDAVRKTDIPIEAQNGAWVDQNTGGVNGNPPSLPPNTTFLVANPGQPGALVTAGSSAVPAVASAVPINVGNTGLGSNTPVLNSETTANSTANGTNANANNRVAVVASNDTAMDHHDDMAVAAQADNSSAVTVVSVEHHDNAAVSTSDVAAPTAVVVVPNNSTVVVASDHSGDTDHAGRMKRDDSTALVSSKVGSAESSQTLSVPGDQPIVAVLPPGSNLSATWNASSGAAPPSVILPGGDASSMVNAKSAASSDHDAMAVTSEAAVHTDNATVASVSSDTSVANATAASAVVHDEAVTVSIVPVGGNASVDNSAASANANAGNSSGTMIGVNANNMMPVILPAGTSSNISAHDIAAIPGAVPVNGSAGGRMDMDNQKSMNSASSMDSSATVANSGAVADTSAHMDNSSAVGVSVPAGSQTVVVVPSDTSVVVDAGHSDSNVTVRVRRDSNAEVSSDINGQTTNQNVKVKDNQPVIAILPPGSNLTATWDANQNGQAPAVGILEGVSTTHTSTGNTRVVAQNDASASSSAVGVAPVVATHAAVGNDANAEVTVAIVSSTVAVESSTRSSASDDAAAAADLRAANAANANGVPVILPVGVTSVGASRESLAAIPGALPLVINGARTSNTKVEVPRPAGDHDSTFVIQQNHRFGVQLESLDLQGADNLKPNVAVYANLTAGALPPAVAKLAANAGHDLTPINMNDPQLLAPESTTGYEKVYDGAYNGGQVSLANYVTTIDLCGQISDKGFLQVHVQPSGNGTVTRATQTTFNCPMNLNFVTATRISEANWSDVQTCDLQNGGAVSGKLTYRIRNYNINWNQCQQKRPSIAVS